MYLCVNVMDVHCVMHHAPYRRQLCMPVESQSVVRALRAGHGPYCCKLPLPMETQSVVRAFRAGHGPY